MSHPLAGCLLLIPTLAWAGAPAIESLTAERQGPTWEDLVIGWTPPAEPVDGYRVWRSSTIDCEQLELVYEGAESSYTDPGVLGRAELDIYLVATFVGAEQGPATEPVYKYPVHVPARPDGSWLSVPYHGPWSKDLVCGMAWSPATGAMASTHAVPERTQLDEGASCLLPVWIQYELGDGAYVFESAEAASAVTWGHGHPRWLLELRVTGDPEPSNYLGFYAVSLPYDHAYADLMEVAGELPSAIEVSVWDPVAQGFAGLRRASSSEPWSGPNLSLASNRDLALGVKVDAPSNWLPRRLCRPWCAAPPARIHDLAAAKAGADVALHWTPDSFADGGYVLFRVEEKARLPLVLSEPEWLSVGEREPLFPVLDAGALSAPAGRLYYQLVGRCGDGSLGAL